MKDVSSVINYYNSQSVEDQMIPMLPNENDKLIKKIFKTSSLIGDYVLSQSAYEHYYSIAKKMVDTHIKQLQERKEWTVYLTEHHDKEAFLRICLCLDHPRKAYKKRNAHAVI